jgi:predicted GH43/DUF377 family glycosyl hydrolase
MTTKPIPSLPQARRHTKNPLLTPHDVLPTDERLEVCCVFNAGALRRNGMTYLLLRVDERPIPQDGYVSAAICRDGNLEFKHYRRDLPGLDAGDSRGFILPDGQMLITVISHLRLATSADGVNFTVADQPFLYPSEPWESYAVQDCRMTEIDGTVYINYSAVSDQGVATALASTTDFKDVNRHGLIFCPDNRNVCIFPEKVNGWYYAMHRPMHNIPLGFNGIWLAQSRDLEFWGKFRRLMTPRPDAWDNHHIGGGAPPIATDKGWLVVYHGSDQDNRYCLGAALLDRENPDHVLCRHPQALLAPDMDYEQKGFFGNVVFTDGVVVQDGLLRVYYGASDQVTCLADYDLEQVMAALG